MSEVVGFEDLRRRMDFWRRRDLEAERERRLRREGVLGLDVEGIFVGGGGGGVLGWVLSATPLLHDKSVYESLCLVSVKKKVMNFAL